MHLIYPIIIYFVISIIQIFVTKSIHNKISIFITTLIFTSLYSFVAFLIKENLYIINEKLTYLFFLNLISISLIINTILIKYNHYIFNLEKIIDNSGTDLSVFSILITLFYTILYFINEPINIKIFISFLPFIVFNLLLLLIHGTIAEIIELFYVSKISKLKTNLKISSPDISENNISYIEQLKVIKHIEFDNLNNKNNKIFIYLRNSGINLLSASDYEGENFLIQSELNFNYFIDNNFWIHIFTNRNLMIDIEINSSNIFIFVEKLHNYYSMKKYINLLEQNIEGNVKELSKLVEIMEYWLWI